MCQPIRSDIAWSNRTRIVVRGKSLPEEVIGTLNLGDFSYLQLTGRMPTREQSRVFNAILVTLVEHGLTPSAIATRLTYAGAPESMQAAVAAGLCGLGSVFVGSMETAARLLYETLPDGPAGVDLEAKARAVAKDYADSRRIVPGVGQIYNGAFLRGLFWLVITPGFWIGSGGWLGWVCHLIAAYTAYTYAVASERGQRVRR